MTGTALSGASAAKAPANGAAGVLFKAQFDGSVGALFAGTKSAAVTPATASTLPVDAELARAVKDMLDRGISLGDVIARLASSLATSVAAQLGIAPQTALQRLTQAFTQALQSPGTGPPGDNAERASSLVSRLRRIAELATGVTNGDSGQPIRLIAGQRSDAAQAGATPAPTDHILRDALNALAAPASPTPDPATAASSAPAAPPAASDGRTVALTAPVPVISTGGDTPLGRILTRALLVDPPPSAPAGAQWSDGSSTRTAGFANRTTDMPAPAAASHGAAASGSVTAAATVLDAFVHAFTGALARNDAAPHQPAALAAVIAPVPPSSASPAQLTGPYAIPIAHDALPVAPVPPAPPLPQSQPHVDANAVVDQILRGMSIRTADGQSEVRLRLVPEHLGDVSVKLVVSGGSVDASITAHTADAQTALAGGQNQLAKTLADAGLKLQSFTVALAGGEFAGNRNGSRPNDAWARPGWRRIGGVESVDVDESDDASLLAVPSFGPPIYAAKPSLRQLNYLV